MTFRNDIQGLRALAFLLVFIFHLNAAWIPGGFLGVDLFLVVSGFLITSILTAQLQRGKFSLFDFYRKRIIRIVPSYLVMLLFVLTVGAVVYMFVDIPALKYYIKNSLFFVSNRVFAEGESYFGAKLSENPVLHTWSLAVEMQFYLLFPLLVYCCRKYLVICFSLIIVTLTLYCSYRLYLQGDQNAMYFSLGARIPEFLIGGLAAVVFRKGLHLGRKVNVLVSSAALAVLFASAYFISSSSAFPGFLFLIPCTAAAALLVIEDSPVSKILSSKVLVKVGEYSYSLYLWHWPPMAFIRYKYESYELTFLQIFFITVFTVLMSWVSYRFVESVFRKKQRRFTVPLIGLVAAGLALLNYSLPTLTAGNSLPDYYVKPIVGRASHYEGKMETFGELEKNDGMLLIGDSNALMLKPFLNKIGQRAHFSFRTLTTNAFPALAGVSEEDSAPTQKEMYAWSQSLVAKTRAAVDEAEIIFLCAISYEEKPSVILAVDRLIKSLNPGQKLVLLSGFPVLDKNPLKINNAFVKNSAYQFKVKPRVENLRIMKDLARGKENVFIYDIAKSKIFSSAPYVNDTVSYYDNVHLNTFGSERLADDLEDDFLAFLNSIKNKK